MISLEIVQELVGAHSRLEDEMTAAIWIYKDRNEVWLVEIIPSFGGNEKDSDPIHFSPGVNFRFPVTLIAGNRRNIESVLRHNEELRSAVIDGQILYSFEDEAESLVSFARSVQAEKP